MKVKVNKILPDKIPKGREILASYVGRVGTVESSHLTINGKINYVSFGIGLSQPFYSRELVEVK